MEPGLWLKRFLPLGDHKLELINPLVYRAPCLSDSIKLKEFGQDTRSVSKCQESEKVPVLKIQNGPYKTVCFGGSRESPPFLADASLVWTEKRISIAQSRDCFQPKMLEKFNFVFTCSPQILLYLNILLMFGVLSRAYIKKFLREGKKLVEIIWLWEFLTPSTEISECITSPVACTISENSRFAETS